MPRSIIKGPLQDSKGNLLYIEDSSDMIKHNTTTVESELNNHDASINNLLSMLQTYPTTNTGNMYTVNVPTLTGLTDNYPLTVKFNAASTGAISIFITPANIGAINVVDYYGNAVTTVRNGLIANLRYDRTAGNFQLLGKGGGTGTNPATATTVLSPYTVQTDNGTVTGAIPTKLSQTFIPGTIDQVISKGQYLGEDQIVKGDPLLVSANVRAGITLFNSVTGKTSVVDTSDATAIASQMLANSIAYVNGAKIVGTIPSKSAQTYYPSTSTQIITKGQYLNGDLTIAAITGTATDDKVLAGATYSSAAGVNRTGTMVDRSNGNIDAGSAYQDGYGNLYLYSSATGYINTASTLHKYDANYIASNIVNGISLFGLFGTATIQSLGGTNYATGTFLSNITLNKTLSFSPNVIIAYKDTSSWSLYYKGVCWRASNSNTLSTATTTSVSGNTISIQLSDGFSNTITWHAFVI